MNFKSSTSGFTLVEMMIVLAIVGILFSITMFPYGYYMQRGYVERATDGLAQEWVLAHKAIRGGIEFDAVRGNHAHLFFVFEKGKSDIESYLFSGTILPDLNNLNTANITKYKTFNMDNGVQVNSFTGSLLGAGDKIGYLISPPYGDGIFFTGSTIPGTAMTGARIILGYPGADTITGRAREVLLRTYLK